MVYETKVDRVNRKLKEISNNYEQARKKREAIVNSINELDKKIDEIDQNIEKTKINLKNSHTNKIKFKECLKSYFKIGINQWLIAMVLTLAINAIIFKKFTIPPIGMITSGIAITALNIFDYKIKNPSNKKYKRIKSKNLDELEKERKKLLEQRLSVGQGYKKAREEELLREKIYKELKPMLKTEIENICANKNSTSNKKDIDTKDIYYKIKLDYSFENESIERKKQILEEELKKYISSKISEIYYNTINTADLSFLNTEELIQMLINEIPKSKHKEILGNIIHAILNFSSNLQGYGVVWFQEDDVSLIDNPQVIFDENNNWNEFKTHEKTDYHYAFKIVYEAFINKVMTKNKIKTKQQ